MFDWPVEILLEEECLRAGGGVAGGGLPAREAVHHAEQVRQEMREARAVSAAEALGDELLEHRALRMRMVHGHEARRRGTRTRP
ncbi:MAG: hypothetical protein WD793_12765 [Steroidobacteraceae bacterium]